VSKKNDISIAVLLATILSVYAFGFFGWQYMPKDNVILYNLYYISIASTIYGFSWIMFMSFNGKWSNIFSCLWVGVSSAALYQELFLDPTNWTWWSLGLVIVVSLNMFLSVVLIQKIKNKNNGSSRNNR